MAAQLAQFSSVEQLINMNEMLKAQQATSERMVTGLNSNMAVGALGRTVVAQGNHVMVGSDRAGSVSFELDGLAADATLHVFDSTGAEVVTQELGPLGGGMQTAAFKLRTGYSAGKYTYSIEAADANGKPVAATTFETGKVEGIRYTPKGPVLVAGPMEIELGNVVEITDAN
jgi:flagellar basal-body rod modification protein FlgD